MTDHLPTGGDIPLHLVKLPGSRGVPRYFWQPTRALRAKGCKARRIPADWYNFGRDAVAALEASAIVAAEKLNAELAAVGGEAAKASRAVIYPERLVKKPGRGGVPRYFWQPAGALRAAGWAARRVPANWQSFGTDAAALEAAAIAAAQHLNVELSRARGDTPPVAAPVPVEEDANARAVAKELAEARAIAKDRRKWPPFLIRLPGAAAPRFFWQPSTKLRALGWRPQRLPDNWTAYDDTDDLKVAAIVKARQINKLLAEARGSVKAALPAPLSGPPVTVGHLVEHYRSSRNYRDLRPSSKRSYEQNLKNLTGKIGTARLRDMDVDRVERFSGDSNPHEIAMLRLLFGHAVRYGWMKYNPASRPGRRAAAPSAVPWPLAAIDAFVRVADRLGLHSVGTAIMLNEWLGQRPDDVLHLGWNAYVDGELRVQQSKGFAKVMLPVDMVPHLVRRLVEERARQTARKVVSATIIACEATGAPYASPEEFRLPFNEVRAAVAAEIPSFAVDFVMPGRDIGAPDAFVAPTDKLVFRHLRHTAVTRLAEAGCPHTLIASITGHSINSVGTIIAHYLTHTRAQARAAFQKRLDAEGGATAVISAGAE